MSLRVKSYRRRTKEGKIVQVRSYLSSRDAAKALLASVERPGLAAQPGQHGATQYPRGRSVPDYFPPPPPKRRAVSKVAQKEVPSAEPAGRGVGVPGQAGARREAAPAHVSGRAAGEVGVLGPNPAITQFVIGTGLADRVQGFEGTTPPEPLKEAVARFEARLPGHASMLDHVGTFAHSNSWGLIAQFFTYTDMKKRGLKGPAVEVYLDGITPQSAKKDADYFAPTGDGKPTLENMQAGVVSHELGHSVYTLLTHEQKKELHRLVAKRLGQTMPDTGPDFQQERYAFAHFVNANQSAIRHQLSKYGCSSRDEFFAECWAEYSTNPKARPLAKAVGEQMERFAHINHGEPETPAGPGPQALATPLSEKQIGTLKKIVEAGKGTGLAKGTLDDPINVKGDIVLAAKLLAEGKHIRLNKVSEVGTLLDKLNEIVAEAKAKGEQAPTFDLCKVSVPKTNLFCVDEETEILTARGWQRYDQLTVGEDVLALDHETGLSRWEPLQAVNVFEDEYRKVLEITGKMHSSLTTLDHRWPVVTTRRPAGRRGWTTSGAGFKYDDAVPLSAPRSDYPTEAKYLDAFVSLVGWAWTEGTHVKGSGFRIYQSSEVYPGNVDLIRSALTSLFGPARRVPRPSSKDPSVPAWRETLVESTGMVSFHLNKAASAPLLDVMDEAKAVRPEFLTALTEAQLRLFIDVSIAADGWAVSGSRFLSQRDERRTRSFEFACALAGVPTHTVEWEDRRPGHEGKRMYSVTLATRNVVKPRNLRTEITFYKGVVWCPTTPSGTWLARRRGSVFFTGNCAESKGVPRAKMPQFAGAEIVPGSLADKMERNKKGEVNVENEFRAALKAAGVKTTMKTVKASYLKATQNELDGPKVAGMSKAMEAGKVPDAPIFVTRDGYIIDGHHRWASKVSIDAKSGELGHIEMPVEELDLEIGEAIDLANEFTAMMGIKPKGLGAAAEGVGTPTGTKVGKLIGLVAKKLLNESLGKNGFTYSPVDNTSPTSGFSVSAYPERTRVIDTPTLTYTDLQKFADLNADLLAKPGHHIGSWREVDPDKGIDRVWLDIAIVSPTQAEAEATAVKYDQKAIFDLSTSKVIHTGGSGGKAGAPPGQAKPGGPQGSVPKPHGPGAGGGGGKAEGGQAPAGGKAEGVTLGAGEKIYNNPHVTLKFAVVKDGKVIRILDKATGKDVSTKQGLWNWTQSLKKGKLDPAAGPMPAVEKLKKKVAAKKAPEKKSEASKPVQLFDLPATYANRKYTEAEKTAALHTYALDPEINDLLRHGDVKGATPDQLAMIGALDQAFEPLTEPRELHRGMVFKPGEMTFQVGSVITDRGYVSTAGEYEVAEGFARDFEIKGVKNPERAVITIKAPAGTPHALMPEAPDTEFEDEVLLPRGTGIRVTSVEKDTDGTIFVTATIEGVPHGKPAQQAKPEQEAKQAKQGVPGASHVAGGGHPGHPAGQGQAQPVAAGTAEVLGASLGPAFEGKVHAGDVVYRHKVGSIIVVHPDGSLTKYSASGKVNPHTSATAEKLAKGHGLWKKVEITSGPVTATTPKKQPTGLPPTDAPDAVVTTPTPEPEVKPTPPLYKSHTPMEFNEAPVGDIPKYAADDKWYFQQKVDGIRGQLVIQPGKKPWFRSRSGNASNNATAAKISEPILAMLGGVTPADGIAYAVDGELLDGKWYVFDLAIGDKDTTPWAERMARAEAWVQTLNDAGVNQIVALPTARTKAEKLALAKSVKDNGGEGVMMKRIDAPYDYDHRVNHTLKAKFVSTADVVVMEVNPGGKESLKIGVMDNGKIVPVGTVSKLGKEKGGTTFKVGDVVEVAYLYATPAGVVYQPRIVKARPDKTPQQTSLGQLRKVNKEVLDSGKLNLSGTKSTTVPMEARLPDQPVTGWDVHELPGLRAPHLSDAQVDAVDRYTGNDYYDLNAALRAHDKLDPSDQADVDKLVSAIARSTVDVPIEVYRGVGKQGVQKVIPDHLQPGTVLTDDGFLSTTTDRHQARIGFGSGALVSLRVPAGAHALSIPSVARAHWSGVGSGEEELLFAPGSRMRVVSDDSSRGYRLIEAEWLPPEQGGGIHRVLTEAKLSHKTIILPPMLVGLANSAETAWAAAAQDGIHHLLLVLKNNPAKTVANALERVDVKEALDDAGAQGAKAVMDEIQAIWAANGGPPDSPYLAALLRDAQHNGVMYSHRMVPVLAVNDHGKAKAILERDRIRAAAGGDVAASRAKTEALLAQFTGGGEHYVRWRAHVDEKTCPWCLALNGVIVPAGSSFPIAGPEPYLDLIGPPRHPNCRCWLEVVE